MNALRRLRAWLELSPADIAITVAVIAWSLAEAFAVPGGAALEVKVAFCLAATVPMALRVRWPLVTFGLAFAAFFCDVFTNVMPLYAVTPYQLLPLATYALLATGWERRNALGFGVIAIGVPPPAMLLFVTDSPVGTTDIVSILLTQTVAVVAGHVVAERRAGARAELAALDAARASEHDVVRAGLDAERRRLATELRGSVADAMARGERELAGIEHADADRLAHDSRLLQGGAAAVMRDLQRLLGVLHDADPGIDEPVSLQRVVAAARRRGWQATLEDGGELPAGAAVAAARVVEETLAGEPPASPQTSVVQIAVERPGGAVRVLLRGGPRPAALRDPVQRGSIQERVRLHGGKVRVRTGRRWRVEAVLPGAADEPLPEASTLLGDVLVIGSAALLTLQGASVATGERWWLMFAAGVLFLVLPLALRRRFPLAAMLVVACGLLLRAPLAGPQVELTPAPLVGGLLGSGSAAMHIAAPRTAAAVAALVTASACAANMLEAGNPMPTTDTAITIFLAAMAYPFGRLVRENKTAADRAVVARQQVTDEQLRAMLGAVQEERRQVARDLHDVVAHGVSMVAVLAGAAAAQSRTDPVASRRSMVQARAAIGEAQVELGRLTAALAGPLGEDENLGGDELARLIERSRAAGQRVRLTEQLGLVASLPSAVAETAYRIVQESLTNARKYAPGAMVHVELRRDGDALLVQVTNRAPAASVPSRALGSGRGIAGMRERAAELGGTLEAGAASDGGFAVRAHLPLQAG